MLTYWQSISFANPNAFFLLVVSLLMLGYYFWQFSKQYPSLTLSTTKGINAAGTSWRGSIKDSLFFLRILAVCLLVVVLARPKSYLMEENISSEGIDIVLAMDISSSMLARDFEPDRLTAAKQVANDFIVDRPNDRIGLVVFAGESFTQCPITTDHIVLREMLGEIKDGMIEDGTAIGMGLATAVNRLKESTTKSKVVILLTDGVNNSGFVDPITASDAAIQYGVRVYTIGVGTQGKAPYPFQYGNRTIYKDVDVKIDEDLLRDIAKATGGQYYRATDNQSLKEIYDEIDTLEKSKIDVATINRDKEEFFPFALAAAVLLLVELLLRYTIVRAIP